MSDVVYAIGDVHGRLDLLTKMEVMISVLSGRIPANDPLVLTIGDYCDEGPQTKEVYERLASPGFARLPRISLPGNHDVWLVRALTMFRNNTPGWQNWLAGAADSGIAATLKSYSVQVPGDFMNPDSQVRVMRGLSAKFSPGVLDMFQAMPPLLFEAGIIFVHAGLNPEYSINSQDFDDCIMGTTGCWREGANFGAPVCVGHRVMTSPFISDRIFGIDTGAVDYGILTAGVFVSGKPYQFLAVCETALSWIPVIVDAGDDSYLSMTRLWWREVMKASPEPPYLAFDDPARLKAFVQATRTTSYRHIPIGKHLVFGRRDKHRIMKITSPAV